MEGFYKVDENHSQEFYVTHINAICELLENGGMVEFSSAVQHELLFCLLRFLGLRMRFLSILCSSNDYLV